MSLAGLRAALKKCPLIASAQAPDGSPLGTPAHLATLAQASKLQGVGCFRVEGVEPIRQVRKVVGGFTIGLIKRHYPDSDVYITPTRRDVWDLLATECDAIAFDATIRKRPSRDSLGTIIEAIHEGGRVAMADCDTQESVREALKHGADVVATTLSGYTQDSPGSNGPDLDLLRYAVCQSDYVLGEGRYSEPWQARAALQIGAMGVVVGGALNDPTKQTARFRTAMAPYPGSVGAVDIGGTWLRFGCFGPDWALRDVKRIRTPKKRRDRMKWIADRASEWAVQRVGVSSGGTVDPATNAVIESKPLIPYHKGTYFELEGRHVFALNDGHAAAWGHSMLPQFAGRSVATLAVGTGVGCGIVRDGRLVCGPNGEYPRLNDLEYEGATVEDVLGGASLELIEDRDAAAEAAQLCIRVLREVFLVDVVVVCGAVGLSDWMRSALANLESRGVVAFSPFAENAGLCGAAALALWPPDLFYPSSP